ncbi:BirA family biotin operon repressor/biotin-[acetyl-CoA-carboxylase] ligase [Microbacterium endophyticum]|uniref:biotin--[biotin carboxyl-carrier protein] ligase n=1 Tax=Microbacterium endophyticum TaxID=1526412 RepID=A0A7W4YP37_9MICO|nr:biotin--[acetyl-CoA-carboxylase] ligase [Microbacterium endophyticum]MBB2976361.1 BirA family biotin operon repressor/biotin-[acetyl-CoA-carboxylase] ligase [Microbacterium endophyticum]NIK35242.1 BirA family biotin operon repressor/biotin-[acetyl-CoA-carboxylase] ligase [Microbacterium endophyticum]
MPIPTEGYPLTAAVSPRVQIVEATDSTNADVVAAVSADPDAWPHLSLLLTTDQRAGRGRLDRTWTAPAGTALAVSVVLRVPELPIQFRGWLPLLSGVAMTTAVRAQLSGSGHITGLKWPNDVLVDGGKISGILAEVVPGRPDIVVVGVGTNTSMSAVDLPVATATSFAAMGVDCNDDALLATFVRELADHITRLMGAVDTQGARAEVESVCTTIGSDVVVSLPDSTRLSGQATALDDDGRLVVKTTEGAEVAVAAGDVVHVRSTLSAS